jgi:hypothetical protein
MVRPSLPVLHKIINLTLFICVILVMLITEQRKGDIPGVWHKFWCRCLDRYSTCACARLHYILSSQTEVGRSVMGQWSDRVNGNRVPPNEMRALKSCFCICVCLMINGDAGTG